MILLLLHKRLKDYHEAEMIKAPVPSAPTSIYPGVSSRILIQQSWKYEKIKTLVNGH